jgi:Family of unknown function (DUF5908)
MPVEIRELVIRAVTTLEAQEPARSPQSQSSAEDRQAIVQECVRQVLRILQKKKER